VAEVHVATSGPLAKELVNTVVAAIRKIEPYAVNQAAFLNPSDSRSAAQTAVYEVWTHLLDDLQIDMALTLATFGIGSGGES
jgi:hypothetical protein